MKASIDAKHNINYVIFPAMIVANSLPQDSALRSELVAGIQDVLDGNGQNALKTAVEKVTSQQLFTALKGLTAKPIFQAQANKLGLSITLDTETTALMNSFGDLLYAAGRGLSYAKINGNSGTLAGLKTDTYGEYNIKYVDKVLDITRSAKMLTGTAKATLNIDLMAALFTEDKDIVVKKSDGQVLYNGNDLAQALTIISSATEEVTMVLNKAQSLFGDVNVNVPLTVQGKTLEMNGHKFVLKTTAASVTMKDITTDMVTTDVDGWYVDLAGDKAYLVQFPVKANGVYYKELDIALARLNGEGTLEVFTNVKLNKDVEITGTMTVKGAAKIDQGSYSFVLANKDATLNSDAPLNVKTSVSGCKGKTTGNYTYTVVTEIIDGDKLYLDVKPEGINASQLQTALRDILKMPNAKVEVLSGLVTTSNSDKLVANGAIAKVTNGDDVYQYTIIIMGDTNCNGRTDAGDNVLMRRHFQNAGKLTGIAFDAADMNRDGTIKSNDAVLNRSKFMRWSSYVSRVNKVLY